MENSPSNIIRLLLAKNTGKAVSTLERYSNFFPDFSDEIILILNRYNNYKRDKIRGCLSKDEAEITLSKIASSILELLDLADERSEIDTVSQSSQNVLSEKTIPALGILVTTIKTIFAVIYGYFQYFKQLRLINDEKFLQITLDSLIKKNVFFYLFSTFCDAKKEYTW